ncbi:hypothetical protein S7711_10386 [Stachybotrys chartarum IBT 7711]|uniref:Ribonuclease P/MRP protein subunit POP5 n=1 Tax=Stachybotrys chartarum (strain CBS 109288 / IBT 7711) TaxID=1280523 RepID=A0A084B054_STACB|nr:hypothetical protein S7711_10386 [Stachybotrys chartarum IBT 7711]KFA77176.1 hypothetical protein S40288_04600 [Stachybotrys chartarum IBT 40288]
MVRVKERYLLVNIIYPPDPAHVAEHGVPDVVVNHQPTVGNLTAPSLLKAIRAEVNTLFGDYGSGALEGNLQVKYLSPATSTFILKCARSHYRLLWSALTFMDHVPVKDGRPCIFRVVRVSGTIRKAEEEAIRQARRLILAAKDDASAAKSLFADTTPQQDIAMAGLVRNSSSDDDDDDGADSGAMELGG